MGLVQDTAICTVAQAAQISHEVLVTNLDDASDTNATIQNALNEATNELIRRCRARGINDPSIVSAASITDMRAFAAFWALFSVFASLEDAQSQTKADKYKKRAEEQWAVLVISTTASADIGTSQDKGLPRSVNQDAVPFFGPTNNRVPGRYPLSGWSSK